MLCHECPFSLSCLGGTLVANTCELCGSLTVPNIIETRFIHWPNATDTRAINFVQGVVTMVCEPALAGTIRFDPLPGGKQGCVRCQSQRYHFSTGPGLSEVRHIVSPTLCLSHKQWQYRRRGKKAR